MRKVSSSIMAALVVVALFWGNCFSCPQLLAALQSHQPAHGCCHKTRQPASGCQTQVLKSFVKAASAAPATVLPIVARMAEPPAPAVAEVSFVPEEQHSPPDL